MKRLRLSLLATLVIALTATGLAQREVRLKPDTAGKTESVGRPESVGMSSERLARVHTAMQGFVDRHQVSGVVTLLARQGQVVELDAIGLQDIETKQAMKPDTLFFIASMTKPITTAAVMML